MASYSHRKARAAIGRGMKQGGGSKSKATSGRKGSTNYSSYPSYIIVPPYILGVSSPPVCNV